MNPDAEAARLEAQSDRMQRIYTFLAALTTGIAVGSVLTKIVRRASSAGRTSDETSAPVIARKRPSATA